MNAGKPVDSVSEASKIIEISVIEIKKEAISNAY